MTQALVKLVASVRGFYDGRIIEAGQEFMFDTTSKIPGNDKPRKLPKWAAPVGEKAAKKAAPEYKAFDTKPADAAAALKKKLSDFGSR